MLEYERRRNYIATRCMELPPYQLFFEQCVVDSEDKRSVRERAFETPLSVVEVGLRERVQDMNL